MSIIGIIILAALALLVLVLVGGLIALIVHKPTRTAGATITAVLAAMLLAAFTFFGYAATEVRHGPATAVIANDHGYVMEMHSSSSPTTEFSSHVSFPYAQQGHADFSAPAWAKLILIVVMVGLVALLTSGEKARGMAVRALGIFAFIVGGMAVLYFVKSVPSEAQIASAPMPPVEVIRERGPVAPPAPVPPAAEQTPPVQPIQSGQPAPQTSPESASKGANEATSKAPESPAQLPPDPSNAPHENPSAAETPAASAAADHEHASEAVATSPTTTTVPSDPPAAAATSATPAPTADAVVKNPEPPAEQKRPEWLDQPPRRVGSEYVTHASSGLFSTVEECERALEAAAKRVVEDYAALYLGDNDAARRIPIDQNFIGRLQRGPVYEEHDERSVGRMVQLHKQLVFDDVARNEIRARWEAVVRSGRLWYLSCGALLVVALVGTLFSYLKLDLMTHGSYRGRLQLAAAAAILVAAAAVLIVR